MYWSRSLLKENAKRVLASSYWRVFLVWLLFTLGQGAVSGIVASVLTVGPLFSGTAWVLGGSEAMYYTSVGVTYFLYFALLLALQFFAASPLLVGCHRYMMENRGGFPPLESIFSVFRGKAQYLNLVKNMALYGLEILGFTLLCIIPGIVRTYQLFYVPWLLAENPYMSYARAKELSIAMTSGEKMEIFVLELSFMGWYLLCSFTCGLGIYFLQPYVQATLAELYAAARAKAFAMGITGEDELGGFSVYPGR